MYSKEFFIKQFQVLETDSLVERLATQELTDEARDALISILDDRGVDTDQLDDRVQAARRSQHLRTGVKNQSDLANQVKRVLVAFLGIVFLLGMARWAWDMSAGVRLAIFLSRSADNINRDLPVSIDQVTRFDRVAAGPGAQFTLLYTFLAQPESVDKNALLPFIAATKSKACNSAFFQELLDRSVTVHLVYRAVDGFEVARFSVTTADCAAAP